jgi:hypothetical protein
LVGLSYQQIDVSYPYTIYRLHYPRRLSNTNS